MSQRRRVNNIAIEVLVRVTHAPILSNYFRVTYIFDGCSILTETDAAECFKTVVERTISNAPLQNKSM